MAAKRQSPVAPIRTLTDVETHNLSSSGECWASCSLSFVSCSNCLVNTWRYTRTTSPCCVLFKSLLMMSRLDWQPSCSTIMHSSTYQVNSYPAPMLSQPPVSTSDVSAAELLSLHKCISLASPVSLEEIHREASIDAVLQKVVQRVWTSTWQDPSAIEQPFYLVRD